LVQKGLISSDAIDGLVKAYEHDIGPMLGAKVVAKAWVDLVSNNDCSTTQRQPVPSSALGAAG
jgi:hypothetical protein